MNQDISNGVKRDGFTPLEIARPKALRARQARARFLTGFTLIELVMALGIITLTIFIFGVAVSSLPLTKSSRNRNIAYHAAAQKIEELRNTAYASLPASGAFSPPILAELPSANAVLTISSYGGYDPGAIKQATVLVTWYENGAWQNVRLDTLISSTGLNQ